MKIASILREKEAANANYTTDLLNEDGKWY